MSLNVLAGIFVAVLLSHQFQSGAGKLVRKPDFIKTCDLEAPNFKECSTSSLQIIWNNLVNGVEELEGMQPLDPMIIDEMDVVQDEGSVNIKGTLRHVNITGFRNVKIMSSDYTQSSTPQWSGQLQVPKITIDSKCEFTGRIFIIPFSGTGRCTIQPSSMDVTYTTDSELYQRGNHLYFNTSNLDIKYTLGGMHVHIEDMFGIKLFEEIANSFLNSNWRSISEIMQSVVTEKIKEILNKRILILLDIVPAEFMISNLPKVIAKDE